MDGNSWDLGSPLFHRAKYPFGKSEQIHLIFCFIEKGAKLDSKDSLLDIMPSHHLAENLALCTFTNDHLAVAALEESIIGKAVCFELQSGPAVSQTPRPSWRTLTSQTPVSDILKIVFNDDRRDTCTSHCSVDGCNVLSAALEMAVSVDPNSGLELHPSDPCKHGYYKPS